VLDAAGRDLVLIETVGVGQDEVDIVRTADISIVVLVPGSGDDIQALKAGIMEIADIFVVNKADREGADRTIASIESMLSLESFENGRWRPPIVKTEATTGKGVTELVEAIDRFRAHTAATLGQRRRARAEFRVTELLAQRFVRHATGRVLAAGEFEALLDRIAARDTDPYSVVDQIVTRTLASTTVADAADLQVRQARLDHVGIAVADVQQALAFYRDALGLAVDAPEEVASQHVRAYFIHAGATALELLEGTSADSPISKYIAKRGPGLHHVTLSVPDIRAALARLKEKGVRLIDKEPRPGAHGSLVAFVHPSAAHGVLVELKQA
jgi:LAO/AO transport system kinase